MWSSTSSSLTWDMMCLTYGSRLTLPSCFELFKFSKLLQMGQDRDVDFGTSLWISLLGFSLERTLRLSLLELWALAIPADVDAEHFWVLETEIFRILFTLLSLSELSSLLVSRSLRRVLLILLRGTCDSGRNQWTPFNKKLSKAIVCICFSFFTWTKFTNNLIIKCWDQKVRL